MNKAEMIIILDALYRECHEYSRYKGKLLSAFATRQVEQIKSLILRIENQLYTNEEEIDD